MTPLLRRIDRILTRVPSVPAAVAYYRDILGLELLREEKALASFKLADDATELVVHSDPDLPAEAIYYLVDDVRDVYKRRASLRLTFNAPPTQVSRGFRAAAKDPFGNVLLLLDRTTESAAGAASIEDAKSPGGLFAGVESRVKPKADLLARLYEKAARTADDLPYTPHFETLYDAYARAFGDDPAARPTRQEAWRHLLNLRKRAKLAKLGDARSRPPDVSPEDVARLREMLGDDIGKRDRLPYSKRFDSIVDGFNKTLPRRLSPHLVWRLVATLAK